MTPTPTRKTLTERWVGAGYEVAVEQTADGTQFKVLRLLDIGPDGTVARVIEVAFDEASCANLATGLTGGIVIARPARPIIGG